jgi:hypothetical protein
MPGVMASSRRAARRHRHLPDGREDEPAVAGPRDAAHDERRPTTEVRELAQLPRGRGDRPQVADGSVEQGERQPSAVRRDHGLNKTARGLYLRSMESLEARAISGAGELGSSPFFSPDGESVGYFVSGCVTAHQYRRWDGDSHLRGAGFSVWRELGAGQHDSLWATHGHHARPGERRHSGTGDCRKGREQVDGPQLLPDGDSVLFSVTMANAGNRRWDLAEIVVQSLSTGERKVLLSGGSAARYVPTGHLVYAVGDALLAVAFDVSRLEVRGGPVSVVQGVIRAGNPTVNTATAQFASPMGHACLCARWRVAQP